MKCKKCGKGNMKLQQKKGGGLFFVCSHKSKCNSKVSVEQPSAHAFNGWTYGLVVTYEGMGKFAFSFNPPYPSENHTDGSKHPKRLSLEEWQFIRDVFIVAGVAFDELCENTFLAGQRDVCNLVATLHSEGFMYSKEMSDCFNVRGKAKETTT